MLIKMLWYLIGNWFASLRVWNLKKGNRILSNFNKKNQKEMFEIGEYANVYGNINDIEA